MATTYTSKDNMPQPIINIANLGMSTTNTVATYARANVAAVTITDLYTVPAGKVMVVNQVLITNTSGSTDQVFFSIKISGTYYRISSTLNVSTAGAVNATFASLPVFTAGTSFSVNALHAVATNYTLCYTEIDAASGLNCVYFSAFTTGNDTVYTCPSDTVTYFLICGKYSFNETATTSGGALIGNDSGVTCSYGLYFNDGSTHQFQTANPIIDASAQVLFVPQIFTAGDYLAISSDSAAAGQFFFAPYIELPATP